MVSNRPLEIIDADGDAILRRGRHMASSPVVAPRVRAELASAETPAAVVDAFNHANDLFPINWLWTALEVAQAVGRIEGRKPGTGTLVSPRLLLTNHHVLETDAMAAEAKLVMNDELDESGHRRRPVRYSLRPERFFLSDEGLDFALVAVATAAASRFGFRRMIPALGKAIEGDHVTIIQHPSGGPKEIAFRQNRITKILGDTIQYQTDTLSGSSGSPVFNDQWELIALHHESVPEFDDEGRWVDVEGRPSGLDRRRTHWIGNEGIRISRIVAAVQKAEVSPRRRHFVEELITRSERSTTNRKE